MVEELVGGAMVAADAAAAAVAADLEAARRKQLAERKRQRKRERDEQVLALELALHVSSAARACPKQRFFSSRPVGLTPPNEKSRTAATSSRAARDVTRRRRLPLLRRGPC